MTFATTKLKATTSRFVLARMTPARCIDSLLSSLGGGVYQLTWSMPLARLERNGAALARVTSVSLNDQWSHDEATGILQVKLAAAPSDLTNILVLFYHLFLTSGMALTTYEDPLNAATPIRQWVPRIQNDPAFKFSVQNVVSGIFSIQDSSVQAANPDSYFNQFFSDNDSFNEKDIDVWQGIKERNADTADIQKIYRGKIKSALLGEKSATFDFYDTFSRFNQPALMGDSAGECYVRLEAASYPNADPSFVNRPVLYHVGRYSRYQTKNQTSLITGDLDVDFQAMSLAFCNSFSAQLGTSLNRGWVLGRLSGDGLRSWTLPSPDGVQIAAGGRYSWGYSGGLFATIDAAVGDRVRIVASAVTYYGRISGIVGTTVNLTLDSTATPGFGPYTITAYNDPVLVLVDAQNNEYNLSPVRDFTTNVTTTSGGNKLVSVTLVNNFEANLTTGNGFPTTFVGPLDPAKHRIFYRLKMDTTNYSNNADFLSRVVTLSGLAPNAATFAAVKSTLPVNACMSIPYFDETDFKTYRDYVEDLLRSTMGIFAINVASEVEYLLVSLPASSDQTDENVILRDSHSIRIDYSDIVTQLIAFNPHNSSQGAISSSPTPSETRANAKAALLHSIQNTNRFRHTLETISARIDQIMGVYSNRRATYGFDVATKYLDAKIGDDVQLSTRYLLGGDTSRSVKLFNISKTSDRVSLDAVDLLGAS